MKKLIRVLLILVLLIGLFLTGITSKNTIVDENKGNDKENTQIKATDLKVGVILIGDETQGYSRAHIEGINKAAGKLGIPEENIEWKERIEDSDSCYEAAVELADDGCKLIISNGYCHQDGMAEAAAEYPETDFVSIGGDYAAVSGIDNYYNAFTNIYEARYLSGIVAGMKLAELDRKGKIPEDGYDIAGNVKVGYVAAYANAEVVSGYTAFYLGMKSVMEHVVMDVQYTHAWFDIDAEATAADSLIKSGCVLIAQHADSTGAADTAEKAWENGRYIYYVGYDQDTLEEAPNATLTCAVSNWSVYYKQLFKSVLRGKAITQDWSKGLSDHAVGITKFGPHVAKNTKKAVDKAAKELEQGKRHVFDTATFTVGGKNIISADAMISLTHADPEADTQEEDDRQTALAVSGKQSYFDESHLRSAPYFDLRIDGITELNRNEE